MFFGCLPKPSEEAYRGLLEELEDDHSEGTDELPETGSFTDRGLLQVHDAYPPSRTTDSGCEDSIGQLNNLAHLEFHSLWNELDTKKVQFGDILRRLEQRAIDAEEENNALKKHRDSYQRVISDLNAQIIVANEQLSNAHNNAWAAVTERKASDLLVADLEQRLEMQNVQLVAATGRAKQADERLMSVWAAMERTKTSTSRKRKAISEPPELPGSGAMRGKKRIHKDGDDEEDSESDVPGVDHCGRDVVLYAHSMGGYSGSAVLDGSGVPDHLTSLNVMKTDRRCRSSRTGWSMHPYIETYIHRSPFLRTAILWDARS